MIKEIQRLKNLGLGSETIARTLGVSRNTVRKYIKADLIAAQSMQVSKPYQAQWSQSLCWKEIKADIDHGKSLRQYWEEHLETVDSDFDNKSVITYSSFWREFKRRFPLVPLDLHKVHPPGERCEADYKGDAPGFGYVDVATGKYVQCRLFGVVLCFSQLFFAKATHTEQQQDFLPAFANAFEYFGGVPLTSAVDNAKASVTRASRYDAEFNPEFARFADHFGTAQLAMRPRKPKDKNLIENHLGVFWRWIRSDIKSKQFFSIGELNRYLVQVLDRFNLRLQRKYGLSRRAKFDGAEKEKLLPLPNSSYEFATWKKAKLHPDCHIQVQYQFFSAPYHLRGKELDVRCTSSFIEIFHNIERVAIHARPGGSIRRGIYVTDKNHRPEAHQAINEFTPRRALEVSEGIGNATHTLINNLLTRAKHPLQHLRRIQGILRLADRYTKADLEAACQNLIDIGIEMIRLDDVEGIIRSVRMEKPKERAAIVRGPNPNLRGQANWFLN
ncbi:MAG: IS21 family transposase [Pseudomonadota bacterium]|nr:IS21 family transposase [Pseudomonadota bacterium]